MSPTLQRWRPDARSFFELRLVLQAVWRPRHRRETLLVDRFAVDDAKAVHPVFDPPERGAHLGKDGRVGLGQREVLFLQLVDVCEIADIRLIISRVASRFGFRTKTFHQFPLELEQSPSVVVDVHVTFAVAEFPPGGICGQR